MKISMEPIGHVVNSIEEPLDSDWGAIESRIVLREELAPALTGLADFSHIVVIFWMHRARPSDILLRRPQDRPKPGRE